MRKSTTVFAALLALILTSGLSLAQHRGGPGHHGFPGDTIRPPHGPMDSLHGGPMDTLHRPPFGKPRGGRVGLKDSCFQVFLSQIPADSAAMITADMNGLQTDQAQADTLRHQLFAAFKAHDSVAIAAIRAQLQALHQQMTDLAKNLKSILDQYKDLLIAVRKDCGGMPNPPHKGGPGSGGTMPLVVTPIVPNPVPTGATASFTYTLSAASDVNITINDLMGTAVKTVFSGNVTDTTAQTVTLDLSGLKPGLYILRVQAGNVVMSQKLMVQ
ncbi:MAG: T9SS type A sorting domain-containing protein [Bacteroidetes bacterium]|nr:T9SS type A sorting domain-containing protein [Bacteroidota bacterium]